MKRVLVLLCLCASVMGECDHLRLLNEDCVCGGEVCEEEEHICTAVQSHTFETCREARRTAWTSTGLSPARPRRPARWTCSGKSLVNHQLYKKGSFLTNNP